MRKHIDWKHCRAIRLTVSTGYPTIRQVWVWAPNCMVCTNLFSWRKRKYRFVMCLRHKLAWAVLRDLASIGRSILIITVIHNIILLLPDSLMAFLPVKVREQSVSRLPITWKWSITMQKKIRSRRWALLMTWVQICLIIWRQRKDRGVT